MSAPASHMAVDDSLSPDAVEDDAAASDVKAAIARIEGRLSQGSDTIPAQSEPLATHTPTPSLVTGATSLLAQYLEPERSMESAPVSEKVLKIEAEGLFARRKGNEGSSAPPPPRASTSESFTETSYATISLHTLEEVEAGNKTLQASISAKTSSGNKRIPLEEGNTYRSFENARGNETRERIETSVETQANVTSSHQAEMSQGATELELDDRENNSTMSETAKASPGNTTATSISQVVKHFEVYPDKPGLSLKRSEKEGEVAPDENERNDATLGENQISITAFVEQFESSPDQIETFKAPREIETAAVASKVQQFEVKLEPQHGLSQILDIDVAPIAPTVQQFEASRLTQNESTSVEHITSSTIPRLTHLESQESQTPLPTRAGIDAAPIAPTAAFFEGSTKLADSSTEGDASRTGTTAQSTLPCSNLEVPDAVFTQQREPIATGQAVMKKGTASPYIGKSELGETSVAEGQSVKSEANSTALTSGRPAAAEKRMNKFSQDTAVDNSGVRDENTMFSAVDETPAVLAEPSAATKTSSETGLGFASVVVSCVADQNAKQRIEANILSSSVQPWHSKGASEAMVTPRGDEDQCAENAPREKPFTGNSELVSSGSPRAENTGVRRESTVEPIPLPEQPEHNDFPVSYSEKSDSAVSRQARSPLDPNPDPLAHDAGATLAAAEVAHTFQVTSNPCSKHDGEGDSSPSTSTGLSRFSSAQTKKDPTSQVNEGTPTPTLDAEQITPTRTPMQLDTTMLQDPSRPRPSPIDHSTKAFSTENNVGSLKGNMKKPLSTAASIVIPVVHSNHPEILTLSEKARSNPTMKVEAARSPILPIAIVAEDVKLQEDRDMVSGNAVVAVDLSHPKAIGPHGEELPSHENSITKVASVASAEQAESPSNRNSSRDCVPDGASATLGPDSMLNSPARDLQKCIKDADTLPAVKELAQSNNAGSTSSTKNPSVGGHDALLDRANKLLAEFESLHTERRILGAMLQGPSVTATSESTLIQDESQVSNSNRSAESVAHITGTSVPRRASQPGTTSRLKMTPSSILGGRKARLSLSQTSTSKPQEPQQSIVRQGARKVSNLFSSAGQRKGEHATSTAARRLSRTKIIPPSSIPGVSLEDLRVDPTETDVSTPERPNNSMLNQMFGRSSRRSTARTPENSEKRNEAAHVLPPNMQESLSAARTPEKMESPVKSKGGAGQAQRLSMPSLRRVIAPTNTSPSAPIRPRSRHSMRPASARKAGETSPVQNHPMRSVSPSGNTPIQGKVQKSVISVSDRATAPLGAPEVAESRPGRGGRASEGSGSRGASPQGSRSRGVSPRASRRTSVDRRSSVDRASLERSFSRLPRVAHLTGNEGRVKATQAAERTKKVEAFQSKVPRGSTHSGTTPKQKTPSGTPKKKSGVPTSPTTPQGEQVLGRAAIREMDSSDRSMNVLGYSRDVMPIRRTLSFSHGRKPPLSPGPMAASQPASPAGMSASGRLGRPKRFSMPKAGARFPKHKPTVPEPFKLGSVHLHERSQQQIEQQRKRADDVERRRRAFRPRPMPDFSKPYPHPAR